MIRLVFALFLLILIISCREDIIHPDEFAGIVNEPVQINSRNSYTFIINAKNLSMSNSALASFNTTLARISVTLIDYETGYVNVSVKDLDDVERFRYFVDEDVSLFTEVFNGYLPRTIDIRLQEFSGKLKVKLSRAY
ncbi:MAG: hypothetical protein DRI23_04685 [Candidatus Cloacimonadota bacterium]|nr:MAG: hypothetical protein DRI23_04685 [Candidatus Cloacimonadota bacterium]